MFEINIWDYLNEAFWKNLIKGLLFLVISIPIILYFRKVIRNSVTKKYGVHYGLLSSKVFYYSMMGIVLMAFLTEIGFSLGPLLGAAGIVGVALGFASQTSVSNIISGLFLIAEKPFEVGDVITVGDLTGAVLSIDTLSIKIRTFYNSFVRIPNEMIIKQVVINITRFPIRRLDIVVGFAYKENIDRVKAILLDIAEKNTRALQEPEPMVNFNAFASSAVEVNFRVWAPKEDFIKLRDEIHTAIKVRFDEEGIEIPFPHVSIYSGEVTKPFPVKMLKEESEVDKEELPG